VLNKLESVPGWSRFNRLLDALYLRHHRNNQNKLADMLAEKLPRRPDTIVIICKGNICRSPFLAEYLNKAASNGALSFRSAALRGQGNGKPPQNAIESAAGFGVDISSHQASLLMDEVVESADLIIGMEPIHHVEFCLRYFRWRHKFLLLRAIEKESGSMKLADPFGRGKDGFRACYELLARDGDILLARIEELEGRRAG
jgi:protein-tyrosine phosphatase